MFVFSHKYYFCKLFTKILVNCLIYNLIYCTYIRYLLFESAEDYFVYFHWSLFVILKFLEILEMGYKKIYISRITFTDMKINKDYYEEIGRLLWIQNTCISPKTTVAIHIYIMRNITVEKPFILNHFCNLESINDSLISVKKSLILKHTVKKYVCEFWAHSILENYLLYFSYICFYIII